MVSALLVALPAVLLVGLVLNPSDEPIAPSDAVVVLAGDAESRLPVALDLAEAGAKVLVVSLAEGEDNAPARALCQDPGELTVLCFLPERSDTRAEARALGTLVADRGWERITVVTSRYHITRAGMLVRRCTDATVQMAAPRDRMPLGRWVDAIVHESAGLVAGAVVRSC